MKTLSIIILISVLVSIQNTVNAQRTRGQSQTELSIDMSDQVEESDKQMRAVVASIVAYYEDDKEFVQKLKKSQETYLKYRDDMISAIFPSTQPGYYGSSHGMCVGSNIMELNNERMKYLKRWTEGIEEGNVCGGSYKIKR